MFYLYLIISCNFYVYDKDALKKFFSEVISYLNFMLHKIHHSNNKHNLLKFIKPFYDLFHILFLSKCSSYCNYINMHTRNSSRFHQSYAIHLRFWGRKFMLVKCTYIFLQIALTLRYMRKMMKKCIRNFG